MDRSVLPVLGLHHRLWGKGPLDQFHQQVLVDPYHLDHLDRLWVLGHHHRLLGKRLYHHQPLRVRQDRLVPQDLELLNYLKVLLDLELQLDLGHHHRRWVKRLLGQ